ncbi:class III extradiol ring-cleavage dioxygenase family protein [Motilibacter rhizosphaerae]|uniref:hypothetical protein n=1 Tax=Motilibacter rhizosphaerae TaxID=598652 RepID=UPI001E45F243|nr:hypothetical protein [Motilibacter rhizosphaerae]
MAAAVVPSPPALVPELASGAAGELDELRAACDAAVAALVAHAPDHVVVVATAPSTGPREADERADLAAYGLDLRLGGGEGPGRFPLGSALGAWLLGRAGWTGPVEHLGVATDEPTATCLALGQALADGSGRTALLCVGDGSARRGPGSPRWPDERAVPWDTAVEEALAAGDPAALAALDPALAVELAVDGRAPWQVLAGAAAGRSWSGELRCSCAPWGVAYAVASWTPA